LRRQEAHSTRCGCAPGRACWRRAADAARDDRPRARRRRQSQPRHRTAPRHLGRNREGAHQAHHGEARRQRPHAGHDHRVAPRDHPTLTPTAVLNWDVFVTPGIPIVTRDKPPGVRETYFQAMASTLIYGMRDAILVDAFMTVEQATALADWVA